MFQFWQFNDIFACEVVDLAYFILKQNVFTSDMKRSKVEFWKSFSFVKAKGDQNLLSFGSKSS